MSVRAGAHNSFKEQRDMLMNIRDETTTKVGKYIRRDISVKVSAKVALDEHHKAQHDAQMTAEEREAAKEHEHKKPEEKPKGVIENPKAINPNNRL